MQHKCYFIILSLILTQTIAWSQDFNFSYYQFTPLTVNPANAGSFAGSYRISGILADKQAAITARPYQNFTLSVDAPIVRGIRKQDWIGIGIQADLIGSSGLIFNPDGTTNSGNTQTWNFYRVGAAYHLALDKKQTRIFTLGVQMSQGSRKYLQLNQNDARVNPQTSIIDQDINRFNAFVQQGELTANTSSRDFNVGLLYNAKQKKSDLRLGVSFEGIFKPSVGFLKDSTSASSTAKKEKKQFGLNLHGAYEMVVNKQLNITPGFYYYSIGPANALNINTQASYLLDPEKDLRLIAGLGMRNLRALMFFAGAEFGSYKVGFNFDLDTSSATAGSAGVGGFELCASYIGKIYKKPKVKPIIFCPRL
ncbi:MAG: type IX secretion system membrane protein PorP/SprF [Saprospiraceae bacterium]|nr:type IX secretion system membrane protein PorP/SprF [Saprospiraceae bacterium]